MCLDVDFEDPVSAMTCKEKVKLAVKNTVWIGNGTLIPIVEDI